MGKLKELEFESYEDAARWFEESDMTDYSEQLVPVELRPMIDFSRRCFHARKQHVILSLIIYQKT